jgi:hypothetical protein
MLLTDAHAIREVILFPLLRAEATETSGEGSASPETGATPGGSSSKIK